jgi:hypothetical protein
MIHQAKSNPELLDEQIFSERLASAISAIGPYTAWAQSGLGVQATKCPLIGAKQTSLKVASTSAFDPKTDSQSDQPHPVSELVLGHDAFLCIGRYWPVSDLRGLLEMTSG